MYTKLEEIGKKFKIEGQLYSYQVITNGNINTTYKVTYIKEDKTLKAYIFQRVNIIVFKNPVEIMKNIDKVTNHIRKNYPNEQTVHFHHTASGENYYIDSATSFWRVMNYIESVTYNTSEDNTVIAATGEAFGHFQMQLSDFDGSTLYETIPDFHNTKKRIEQFFSDVEKDEYKRVNSVQEEIKYITEVKDKASEISVKYYNGEIPIRVTHNDTKSNNVLFDKMTKRPLVVIDLDTVMPGTLLSDFGDAVRFICNTSAEDEPDTNKVYFDTQKFRAFTKGYLTEVKDTITEIEINNLVLSIFSIAVELGTRFLDDYITGDKYFKVNYPGHNVVRTRCQFKLAKDIMRKYDELNEMVKEEYNKALNK